MPRYRLQILAALRQSGRYPGGIWVDEGRLRVREYLQGPLNPLTWREAAAIAEVPMGSEDVLGTVEDWLRVFGLGQLSLPFEVERIPPGRETHCAHLRINAVDGRGLKVAGGAEAQRRLVPRAAAGGAV